MYDLLFNYIHEVKLGTLAMLANDSVKLNNAINTCLLNLKIIGPPGVSRKGPMKKGLSVLPSVLSSALSSVRMFFRNRIISFF